MKVSVMYIAIGAENLILLRAHKTRGRPPVIPTATSLGIKIKIFMIKVCKSFMCACSGNCAFRGDGQQISEFQILICV
jgi:hypothetical protein